MRWVRLDTNLPSHDKTLRLLQNKRHGWHAFGVYVMGLAWAGAQGTDGHIPDYALPMIHGTQAVADLLVDVHCWEPAPTGGWLIRNWDKRQDTQQQVDIKRGIAELKARKGACIRWHGPDCHCWKHDA